MQKIIDCEYEPLPDSYSGELKDLIAMCLQADQNKRVNASKLEQVEALS